MTQAGTSARRALQATTAVGWVRLVIGGVLMVRPRVLPEAVGFHAGTAPAQEWLVRMMAAREAALGVGTLAALRTGQSPRFWLWAQALSDAGDATALLPLRRRPVGRRRVYAIVAFAVAGTTGDLVAARALRGHGGAS